MGKPGRETSQRQWAATLIVDAMKPTMIAPLTALHVVFVAFVLWELPDGAAVPVAAHLVAIVLGVLMLRGMVSPVPPLCATSVAFAFDVAALVDGDGAFMLFCQGLMPLATMMPILLYRGARAIAGSAAASALIVGTLLVAHPGWGGAAAVLATSMVSLCVAAWVLTRKLLSLAADVDQQELAGQAAAVELLNSRAAHDAGTEYLRLLHDTAINTFGALARDEAAQLRPQDVRDRCRRDIAALTADDWGGEERVSLASALEVEAGDLLPIRWHDGLDREEVLVDGRIARALRGCLTEALRNATKHSGADHVSVALEREGETVVVEVRDDGMGFAGEVRRGRGLEQSLLGRANAAGIEAAVRTEPGGGTRVTLRFDPRGLPLVDAGVEDRTARDKRVRGFIGEAAFLWGCVAIGAALATQTVALGGLFTWTHLALVIVGILCVLARACYRRGGRAADVMDVLLASAAPGVLVLSLVESDFGREPAFAFTASGIAPPLVFMIASSRRWRAWGAIALTSVVAAALAGTTGSAERALHILIMMLPVWAYVAAWLMFVGFLGRIVRRYAQTWRATTEALERQAVIRAADETRRRWGASGVADAIALLEKIANGDVDVRDPAVRRRSGLEELHLRQVSALAANPALLTRWWVRALTIGRSRSVARTLQAGGVELEDAGEADALGRFIVAFVSDCLPGSQLTLTLVAGRERAQLILVGDAACGENAAIREHADELTVRAQVFETQVVVEVEWSGERSTAVAS